MLKAGVGARTCLQIAAAAIAVGTIGFLGCERKERVLDVKTPGTSVQVDRNVDTGKVDVEVKK